MKTKKMIIGLKTDLCQRSSWNLARARELRAREIQRLYEKNVSKELETLKKRYENNNKFDKSDFVSLFEVPVALYGCLDWEVSVGWEEGVDGAEEEVEKKVQKKFRKSWEKVQKKLRKSSGKVQKKFKKVRENSKKFKKVFLQFSLVI